jgi:hypothetical protein
VSQYELNLLTENNFNLNQTYEAVSAEHATLKDNFRIKNLENEENFKQHASLYL